MAPVRVKNLCKMYGGAHAVDDISFEIFGLREPDGAGQSTTVNVRYNLWHT